jgi:hypothetical protein
MACVHHFAFFCLAFLVRAAFSPFPATSSNSLVPSVISRTGFLVRDQRAWAARRVSYEAIQREHCVYISRERVV